MRPVEDSAIQHTAVEQCHARKLDTQAPKWLNSLARAEPPLICFLRARMVLIKGVKNIVFTLLFVFNHRHYKSRTSNETVIAVKEKHHKKILYQRRRNNYYTAVMTLLSTLQCHQYCRAISLNITPETRYGLCPVHLWP